MGQIEFETYLTDRYQREVNWYDDKAVENQTVYSWMQWTIIALAAITPILIEVDFNSLLDHVPSVTAALVAILTAGLKTFKFEEHWINYRTTCETLRKEKHFYDWNIEGYETEKDPKAKQALFVDRVEQLISRENTFWLKAQQSRKKPSGEKEEGGD